MKNQIWFGYRSAFNHRWWINYSAIKPAEWKTRVPRPLLPRCFVLQNTIDIVLKNKLDFSMSFFHFSEFFFQTLNRVIEFAQLFSSTNTGRSLPSTLLKMFSTVTSCKYTIANISRDWSSLEELPWHEKPIVKPIFNSIHDRHELPNDLEVKNKNKVFANFELFFYRSNLNCLPDFQYRPTTGALRYQPQPHTGLRNKAMVEQ